MMRRIELGALHLGGVNLPGMGIRRMYIHIAEVHCTLRWRTQVSGKVQCTSEKLLMRLFSHQNGISKSSSAMHQISHKGFLY